MDADQPPTADRAASPTQNNNKKSSNTFFHVSTNTDFLQHFAKETKKLFFPAKRCVEIKGLSSFDENDFNPNVEKSELS